MTYLRFDDNGRNPQTGAVNNTGHVQVNGNPQYNEIPIAINAADGRVVYGSATNHNIAARGRFNNLLAYDDNKYKLRRKLCDSALGMIMLENRQFYRDALNTVNNGISGYIANHIHRDMQYQVVHSGRWLAGATSFGRLPPANNLVPNLPRRLNAVITPGVPRPYLAEVYRWMGEMRSLRDTSKVMSLHDIFLKIYVDLERTAGNQNIGPRNTDQARRMNLRPQWYDDRQLRGRTQANANPGTSVLPGIVPRPFGQIPGRLDSLARAGVRRQGFGDYGTNLGEQRNRKRGTDEFGPTANLEGNYARDLQTHKLNFSASASGTTSTLLTCAKIFARAMFNDPERLRQYIMACVAYLVGGGMHTCHEVFHTAALPGCGLPYNAGRYQTMLPMTFTGSALYRSWREEFWDVTMISMANRVLR